MSITLGTIGIVLLVLCLVFAVVSAVIYGIVDYFHHLSADVSDIIAIVIAGAMFIAMVGYFILSLGLFILSPSSLLNEKIKESYVIDTEYPYSIEVSGKRWLINGQTSQNKVITFDSVGKKIEYVPSEKIKIEKCKATKRYSREFHLFGKQIEIYDDTQNLIFYRIYAPETAVKETVVIK